MTQTSISMPNLKRSEVEAFCSYIMPKKYHKSSVKFFHTTCRKSLLLDFFPYNETQVVSRFSRIGLCFDNWWKTHELENTVTSLLLQSPWQQVTAKGRLQQFWSCSIASDKTPRLIQETGDRKPDLLHTDALSNSMQLRSYLVS